MAEESLLACIRREVGARSPGALTRVDELIGEIKESLPLGQQTSTELDMALHLRKTLDRTLAQRKYRVALATEKAELILERTHGPDSREGEKSMSILTPVHRQERGQDRLGGIHVEGQQKYWMDQGTALFIDAIAALRRKGFLGLKRDQAGEENLVKAGFGDVVDDEAAKSFMETWTEKVDPFFWRAYQRAGGQLAPKKGYMIPMKHDRFAIRAARKAPWIAFVRTRLDRAEMRDFDTGIEMDDDELDELLGEIYDTMAMDGFNKIDPQKNPHGNKRRLADRRTAERVLHWKDSESWLSYDKQFGSHGNIFESFVSHMERMSRDIGVMNVLGPDPDGMMTMLEADTLKRSAAQTEQLNQAVDDAVDAGRGVLAAKARRLVRANKGQRRVKAIRGVYSELMNQLEDPVTQGLANGSQTMRNYLTAAQLGGAFLTAVTDWNFMHLAARMNGLSTSQVFTQTIHDMVSGGVYKTNTDTLFAARLGLGADSWISTAIGAQRFSGELAGSRTSRLVADAVLRTSLLTPWTQAGRHSFGLEMMGFWGNAIREGRRMTDLPPGMQAALRQAGVSEDDWTRLSKVDLTEHDGLHFVSLSDVTEAEGAELASRFHQMVTGEMDFAIPTSNARARAGLKGGLQAGMMWSETLRTLTMYKSFPVTLMTTHLARAFNPGAGMSAASYAAQLGIITTILGGVAHQAKQVAAGKEPTPMDSTDFWTKAAMQGGALGIWGDMIFNKSSLWGGGVTDQLAGPGVGLVDDFWAMTQGTTINSVTDEDTNFGRQVAAFARTYTPGSNIWYARLAMERLIFDNIQQAMDPDYARSFRQKRNRAVQDGTEFFSEPGSMTLEATR